MQNCNEPELCIQIAFLKPIQTKYCLNTVVALLTGGFSHVEMNYPDPRTGDGWLSTSIHGNEKVCLTPNRNFSNPGYTVICLLITRDEYNRLHSFVQKAFDSEIGFDEVGMYCSLLPFHIIPKSNKRTFCSRYITECLQVAGVPGMEQYNACVVSPSKLQRILTNNIRRVVGALDSRMRNMNSADVLMDTDYENMGEDIPLMKFW